MSQTEKSYTDQLNLAQRDLEAFLFEHRRVEELSRRSYQKYAEHSGRIAELAVRALGAGEDLTIVAEIVGFPRHTIDGRKKWTYSEVEEFIGLLGRGMRDWVIAAFPESMQ
jgi:hypothetical protein